MTIFSLDSSCMVAAVCTWHERHVDAIAALEHRLARGQRLVVAAHAVVETYAVLTRLPAPHRLGPGDAWTLVQANFIQNASIVALSARAHVTLLAKLASAGIGGGRTYDALIAASAARGGVTEFLTFNPRHFDSGLDGMAIVEPAAP